MVVGHHGRGRGRDGGDGDDVGSGGGGDGGSGGGGDDDDDCDDDGDGVGDGDVGREDGVGITSKDESGIEKRTGVQQRRRGTGWGRHCLRSSLYQRQN